MKKALTIYIDDDAYLYAYNAAFVLKSPILGGGTKDKHATSFTMQNEILPADTNALYIPWKIKSEVQRPCFFNNMDELPDEKDWRMYE